MVELHLYKCVRLFVLVLSRLAHFVRRKSFNLKVLRSIPRFPYLFCVFCLFLIQPVRVYIFIYPLEMSVFYINFGLYIVTRCIEVINQ